MNIQEWLGEDNQIGIDIWKKKYQRNNETFDEWISRVSGGDEDVSNAILNKKFLFGGRILSNRGVDDAEEKTTYSNCYVISPPEDNIESIYETAKKLARTYSYGGGCGIDISKLSPKGSRVRNQAKNTSGAVSFMDTFSQVTDQIGQNGRRGALMISIDCTHPDLEDFITVKSDLGKVTSANISVRVSDDFMNAVNDDADWELFYERPETGEVISKIVRAKDIYHLLCKNNWDYAEPGILFWDKIENYNLLSNNPNFHYAGTNPCAEEPLPAGGSCLLGAINLAAFVKDGSFDFDDFEDIVSVAVIALNTVLDEGVDKHPLQEQRESVRDWRQIGLGIMGLADMLIKCGIKYGSEESIKLCDKIGWTLANEAIKASSLLTYESGTYPKYDNKVWLTDFYKNHVDPNATNTDYPLRNSQLLTIAPTGSISTMIGVSGGIEPIFANSYTRMTKSLHGHDEVYKIYTPIVKNYMDANGLTEEEQLPDYFVTSSTISIDERINMQSIWQSHIDASISSTVNLPKEATVEDVEHLYMKAWQSGLKGITIYRAGCKRDAILNAGNSNESDKKEPTVLQRGTILECSEDLIGKKRKLTTGCGSLHVLAFFDPVDGSLQEVYFNKGSTGGCANFMTGLSRTVSLLCRAGVDIHTIKDQLDSTGSCPSYATRRATHKDTSKGSCCPMAIGNALIDMWNEMQEDLNSHIDEIPVYSAKTGKAIVLEAKSKATCPQCGESLRHEGGCIQCPSCGWSKCD